MQLKDYMFTEQESNDLTIILEWNEILANPSILDDNVMLEEGITDTFKGMIDTVYKHSATLKKHSHGGLLSQLKSAATNGWKFLKAVVQFYNKKITEEEFKAAWEALKPNHKEIMDFLINLDMITLHMVTGPLHMIGAITGIHIDHIVGERLKKAGIKTDSEAGLITNLYAITKQLKDKVVSVLSGENAEKASAAIINLAAALPGPTPEEYGLTAQPTV